MTSADPIGVIARGLLKEGSDFSHGKPSERDFVMVGVDALDLDLPYDDELVTEIADCLYEDGGEKYGSAQEMAAFIHAELTRSA
jgi:hypothetical protein